MTYAESEARIADANYYNDSRTQGERKIPTVYIDDEEIELPSKFDVCPTCEGKGTHVNPSIDAGGLSGDSLDDPEFMESYREGHYDQTCSTCAGRRVVPVVDKARCSADMLAQYHEQLELDAECRAEHLAEIRAGA